MLFAEQFLESNQQNHSHTDISPGLVQMTTTPPAFVCSPYFESLVTYDIEIV